MSDRISACFMINLPCYGYGLNKTNTKTLRCHFPQYTLDDLDAVGTVLLRKGSDWQDAPRNLEAGNSLLAVGDQFAFRSGRLLVTNKSDSHIPFTIEMNADDL